MTDSAPDGRKSPVHSGSSRRQRAPTITIDTSAVSPPLVEDTALPLSALSNRPRASQEELHQERGEDHEVRSGQLATATSAVELRAVHSFDSRDSRPTSPHNVSLPTPKWSDIQPHNLLSVPAARSRGNSVDSDDIAQSPTSYGGDTYISSPASSQGEPDKQSGTTHSNDSLINDVDALKPDLGTEMDFDVTDNRFAFSPGQLNKLLNPKSLGAFYALGGLRGLEKGLRTNRTSGLSVDEKQLPGTISFEEATAVHPNEPIKVDLADQPLATTATTGVSRDRSDDSFIDRKRIFKDNRLPEKKAKSIFELAWIAYNDKVLILLTVAAVVSLALGIYQSVSATGEDSKVAWVEGVAIIVAIVIVVIVGAANDWQKERQFVKLNKKKDDRVVKVVRSGKSREISVYDILVGDVMHMEPGDLIPVDGIFITGHNVTCDESSATGESDLLKKTPADEVFRAIEAHENVKKLDPFIISGAKVNEGVGTFLVTSVGVNSSHGKTMMSLREDAQTTPLQAKLNILAEYIAKLGLSAGLLLFTVTFIEFLVRLRTYSDARAKGQEFLNVFIVAVTVVVVAVPEGLPLAVTLALAFATTRMLKDNNLVRVLRACETMGNATTICSDKTGTLTQNKMSVVAGTIGTASRFGDKKPGSELQTAVASEGTPQGLETDVKDMSIREFISSLSVAVKDILKESIVINTTAFEGEAEGQDTFIGSKTETALLSFAREHLAMRSLNEERSGVEVVQLIPFDSGRKCMGTAVHIGNNKYRLYVKGASEIMLAKCNRIVRDPTKDLTETHITNENMETLTRVISSYASRSLRTIGILYKDFEQWPPKGTQADDPKVANFDKLFRDMVFLGIVGIQDPLREGVPKAVRDCQNAGVFVRMVTGDNLLTAKAIAEECGIYTSSGIIMEGPKFRSLNKVEMNQVIPRLQVLARSSPNDKRILVKRLKENGETVAVTGDGTNDAPALKTADVGFSMGIAGTEVAKEASAIILMDDNFASIVKAIMWGRAVNDSVKKFLQVTPIHPRGEAVLTAVQLLWVNLIMDTLAALALATDPPGPSILNRKPEPKSAPLITLKMWKMIIGQSIYQLVVTLILTYAGTRIINFEADTAEHERDLLTTLIFNSFVWMQIFNQYNSRRLDSKLNIFEGMFRNYFFIGIQFIIVAGQVMIIFVGGRAFSVTPLNGVQWGISLILGVISIPVAIVIRLIPDEVIRKLIPAFFVRKKGPDVFISDEEQQYQWNPALEEIKEELAFLKKLRGGRLNTLKYKLQHPRALLPRSRSGSRSRTSSITRTHTDDRASELGNGGPPTPDSRRSMTRKRGRSRSNSAFGPATAMAGIIAGSIAGWSALDRRDEEGGSSRLPQLHDRSELEKEPGVEVHPDTKASDPVLADGSHSMTAPPSQRPETTPETSQQLA
ncbi:MAG: hypothetical protein Q9187_000726 [Circinaria calcarea]